MLMMVVVVDVLGVVMDMVVIVRLASASAV